MFRQVLVIRAVMHAFVLTVFFCTYVLSLARERSLMQVHRHRRYAAAFTTKFALTVSDVNRGHSFSALLLTANF